MTDMKPSSVYDRRSLFVWASFCILAGLIFLAYALTSLALGRGVFVMPLDDVYIHFQYAKQMALGQPYIYNPGLPPTSGATSFLYPYMLAIGYLLGFQGLTLGLWAMLLGMVALACSTWVVYRLVKVFDAPEWLAILVGIIFALSGPVSWHFMSGMETGWAVLFTLGTLYSVLVYPHPLTPSPLHGEGEQRRVRNAVVFATLLALIRPEGGILAGLAMVAWFFQMRTPPPSPLPVYGEGENAGNRMQRRLLPLVIPILAIGIQPLVNLLLTGSAVASGNAAKSVFGVIPFYWDEVIGRILGNWAQMWREFFSGSSPREGLYIAPLMLVLSIIGLLALLRERKYRVVGLMLIGWLAFGTLAISTLDTAFWHFKRYQMPFMVLLFPLAGWGVVALWEKKNSQTVLSPKVPFLMRLFNFLTTTFRDPITELLIYRPQRTEPKSQIRMLLRGAIILVVGFTLVISVSTAAQFLWDYGLNVNYIYQQPLQMTCWLEANTPPDAVIAVHDVGMMRYMGGRTTLDMVGLTTPGAADYWRNGPGSVAEFLIEKRPDYIASYGYGHGFGLGMLADTDLYGQPLASFPVDLDPNYNVALAANFQGIYKPDWKAVDRAEKVSQPSILNYLKDFQLVDTINMADLDTEKRHGYEQDTDGALSGFPTEVHEFSYLDCSDNTCLTIDSGRRIRGMEWFWLSVKPNQDLILVMRVHPEVAGKIQVYAAGYNRLEHNGTSARSVEALYSAAVATRWIPSLPGHWMEIAALIPRKYLTENSLAINVASNFPDGFSSPYYIWAYQGDFQYDEFSGKPLSSFQDGAIVLASAKMEYQAGEKQMPIDIDWYTDGSAQGDYKVFVHILDEHDQIVAQADTYPGNGTLPPGNWLPGILHDRIMVDLQNTPPGKYRVAMGLYNPYTFERLQPAGGDDQNRFFIGDVEIK